MIATTRSVTLYGSLVGEIWMPATTATLPVRADLLDIASRFVGADGSGLTEAVRAVVDGAGDFRCARLAPDSRVVFEHRRWSADGSRTTSHTRHVDVASLPSLADYVSADWPKVAPR